MIGILIVTLSAMSHYVNSLLQTRLATVWSLNPVAASTMPTYCCINVNSLLLCCDWSLMGPSKCQEPFSEPTINCGLGTFSTWDHIQEKPVSYFLINAILILHSSTTVQKQRTLSTLADCPPLSDLYIEETGTY